MFNADLHIMQAVKDAAITNYPQYVWITPLGYRTGPRPPERNFLTCLLCPILAKVSPDRGYMTISYGQR